MPCTCPIVQVGWLRDVATVDQHLSKQQFARDSNCTPLFCIPCKHAALQRVCRLLKAFRGTTFLQGTGTGLCVHGCRIGIRDRADTEYVLLWHLLFISDPESTLGLLALFALLVLLFYELGMPQVTTEGFALAFSSEAQRCEGSASCEGPTP